MSLAVMARNASMLASARKVAVVVWVALRIANWPVVKTTTSAVSAIAITVIAIRSSTIRKPCSLRV